MFTVVTSRKRRKRATFAKMSMSRRCWYRKMRPDDDVVFVVVPAKNRFPQH
jgi:hypothetical protein